MLYLNSATIARIRTAQSVLLSPLSYETEEQWCVAVLEALRPMVGADIAWMGLAPDHGVPRFVTRDFAPSHFAAIRSPGVEEGMIRLGDADADATHRHAFRIRSCVYDARAMFHAATGTRLEESRIYADYIEPLRVVDPHTLHAALPEGAAMIALGHTTRRHAFVDGDDRLQIATLLVPFLRAGAAIMGQLVAAQTGLHALASNSGLAMMAFSVRGSELFRSDSANDVIATDPEPEAILAAARVAAAHIGSLHDSRTWTAATLGPTIVTTAARSYEITAVAVPPGFVSAEHAVLIRITARGYALPTVAVLREQYTMTAREAEITLLLAMGESNKHIGTRLGIRATTVRTHVENIFRKLGVNSRNGLDVKLMTSRGDTGSRRRTTQP